MWKFALNGPFCDGDHVDISPSPLLLKSIVLNLRGRARSLVHQKALATTDVNLTDGLVHMAPELSEEVAKSGRSPKEKNGR